MVAELQAEDGQSIIEFVLLLPLMMGLVVLMVKINSAIQVSIVNQKYARMQAHFVTFNSPFYPQFSADGGLTQRVKKMHHLTMGIAATPIAGTQKPKAMEVVVARNRALASDRRANVRIRTTVSLCSFSHTLGSGADVYDAKRLAADDVNGTEPSALFDFCNFREVQ